MTTEAWTFWLRVLQALDMVGVLTLIVNGFIKSQIEGRPLKPWIGGLTVGAVFGTVVLGVPFLTAGVLAEMPEMRWIMLQYFLCAGVLMPLWLDPIVTIKSAFDRRSYKEGPRALVGALGVIVLIGLVIAFSLFIINR